MSSLFPFSAPRISGIKSRTVITVKGRGFNADIRLRAFEQGMPNVDFRCCHEVQSLLLRPAGTPSRPKTIPFTAVLGDGTPSNSIWIAPQTSRMLVLGDSIAWGQGLEPQDKFSSLVESELRRLHQGTHVYTTVLAHSGAIIGRGDKTDLPALPGEVPTKYPTILTQVATAAGADKENVDLILMDGGINDVTLEAILNPTTPTDTLRIKIQQYLQNDMEELLRDVMQQFKNARIIVTGYYQIISDQSEATLLHLLLTAMGVALAGIEGAIVADVLADWAQEVVIRNCAVFASEGNAAIKNAVNAVNGNGPPRVFFADPGFKPANAALAPDALVYGINLDTLPQDPPDVARPRAAACVLAGSRTDLPLCERASAGHPNPEGAAAYAKAILPFIE